MKKISFLTNHKWNRQNLFFYGCRWSIFITAYVLIAVVIVLSSEDYFKEGIYAAQVAYTSNSSADANTEKGGTKEIGPQNIQNKNTGTLSDKVMKENGAAENAFAQETSSPAVSCMNMNVIDSVVMEQAEVKKKEEAAQKKEGLTKNEEVKEAFTTVGDSSAKIKLSSKDKNVLLRIVEAEATGESIRGKMLVANVVLNRVRSSKFPDTVEKVVFQKNGSVYQFSPIKDGRYYKVNISNDTKKAVNRVLNGEDYSQGALFFMSRSRAVSGSVTWFDTKLCKVFKYGTHEFYK